MGATASQIQSAVPGFDNWLRHVFKVMGGFMVGTGLLAIVKARFMSPRDKIQSLIVLALAGTMSVGTMSVTNFQIGSDFKWLLLLPSLLWGIGLVFLVIAKESPDTA